MKIRSLFILPFRKCILLMFMLHLFPFQSYLWSLKVIHICDEKEYSGPVRSPEVFAILLRNLILRAHFAYTLFKIVIANSLIFLTSFVFHPNSIIFYLIRQLTIFSTFQYAGDIITYIYFISVILLFVPILQGILNILILSSICIGLYI